MSSVQKRRKRDHHCSLNKIKNYSKSRVYSESSTTDMRMRNNGVSFISYKKNKKHA